VEHTFNLRQISAFKVTLDYKAARATQRNHISKKRKNNERKKGRKKKSRQTDITGQNRPSLLSMEVNMKLNSQ
jgi:hypothetical protein